MLNIEKYTFFNPSPNFREMMILKLISEDNDISQDKISKNVGIVPSMVNKYLKVWLLIIFIGKSVLAKIKD